MSDERGVLDLQVEPPALVVLDTSAIAVALLEDQPSHREYSAFLLRAVERRTTFAYCELVDLELAQACSKRARAQHAGDRSLFVPEGRRLIAEVFGRWRAIISQTQSVRMPLGLSDDPRVLGSPVRDAAFGLIERYGLDSYDAIHAATAIILGAPLVCADRGFAHAPAELLTIITDSTGAEECRRLRVRS